MLLKREYLKLIPGVVLCANLYRGIKFIRRTNRLRKSLVEIDKSCPFNGPIGKLGFDHFFLSKKSQEALVKLSSRDITSTEKKYHAVNLSVKERAMILEIFSKITPRVRDYLGDNCFLDGINWFVSENSEQSISENWHTDNVGNRIKVFICVDGDGSQPTYIIPSKDRIPSQRQWLFNTLNELRRWVGRKNKNKLVGEKALEHKTGTVFLFDTQLLHRGSYFTGRSRRVIFHLEFSDPSKHEISRGPIGTQEVNSFRFSKELLEIQPFTNILDSKRIQKQNELLQYSQ